MDHEHKDALDRARNLHKDAIDMGAKDVIKICEIIFPELAESEEERIRKLLIRLFSSNNPDEKFDNISTQDILAWLEKKSEQKPTPKLYNDGYKDAINLVCDALQSLIKEWSHNDSSEEKYRLEAYKELLEFIEQ